MNASLRTIFAATFLAVTASAGQAASPRIIRDDAVSSRHVAAPSSLTTTFSLARVTVNGTTKPPGMRSTTVWAPRLPSIVPAKASVVLSAWRSARAADRSRSGKAASCNRSRRSSSAMIVPSQLSMVRQSVFGPALSIPRKGTPMEIHEVRYFLALSETRNFTKAAAACHVTQPALTRAIRKLEEELGAFWSRASAAIFA